MTRPAPSGAGLSKVVLMIVETTGDFMLLDLMGGQEIPAFEAVEVRETEYVLWALGEGLLRDIGASAKAPEANADAPTSGRAARAK